MRTSYVFCDSNSLLFLRELRCHNVVIVIGLQYDYDPTTTYRFNLRLLPIDAIRREQKMNMSIFRRIVVS